MTLSRRETLLIMGLVLLAVAAGFYFLVSQLSGYEQQLGREVTRKQALLAKAVLLTDSLSKFNGKPSKERRRKPLIGYIEQLAARTGLKDRIQLNLMKTNKGRNVEGINLKLDNLTLDELVTFIHAVENSVPVLAVEQVDITSAFRSKDYLRLSARILAKK